MLNYKETAQRHLHGGFQGKYSTMLLQTAWQGEQREGKGEGREVLCSQGLQTLCNMWHWNLLVLVPKTLNTVRKQHPFLTKKCGLMKMIMVSKMHLTDFSVILTNHHRDIFLQNFHYLNVFNRFNSENSLLWDVNISLDCTKRASSVANDSGGICVPLHI